MVSATNVEGSKVERRVEGGVVVLEDARGSARVEQVAPHVVLTTLTGRHTEGLARAISSEVEAVMKKSGAVHNFYDGWAQEGHDPPIRHHWQAWAEANKTRLRSTQMLYRPKNTIATMATTVANLVLGGSLTIHTSQAAFEAALRAARDDRS
ncbi:MAG: hypothetical protein M3Y87_08200 [Myxococcota bacterium]|nr:hypothetical protein [Myxococcota bacterium]